MALADDIQMARQHVRQGQRHIAEQRGRIAELERLGLSADKAQEFLEVLESLQSFHDLHLSRLLETAQRGGRSLDAPHFVEP